MIGSFMEDIFTDLNSSIQLLCEKAQIANSSITYALKLTEYLLFLRNIFHDYEMPNTVTLKDEDEPKPSEIDSMQCFRITKRKRSLTSLRQYEEQQRREHIDHGDQGQQQHTTEEGTDGQIISAIIDEQAITGQNSSINHGSPIFLTPLKQQPLKDRLYVRRMIAREKQRNPVFYESLANSIQNYHEIDLKATESFQKYIQGHSLGPLVMAQPISPLKETPKELILPKNIAFYKGYHRNRDDNDEEEEILEGIEGKDRGQQGNKMNGSQNGDEDVCDNYSLIGENDAEKRQKIQKKIHRNLQQRRGMMSVNSNYSHQLQAVGIPSNYKSEYSQEPQNKYQCNSSLSNAKYQSRQQQQQCQQIPEDTLKSSSRNTLFNSIIRIRGQSEGKTSLNSMDNTINNNNNSSNFSYSKPSVQSPLRNELSILQQIRAKHQRSQSHQISNANTYSHIAMFSRNVNNTSLNTSIDNKSNSTFENILNTSVTSGTSNLPLKLPALPLSRLKLY